MASVARYQRRDPHTVEWWRDRLDAVERRGDSILGRCPAHDDGRPSLHVTPKGKGTLVYCFAGCAYRDILAAVEGHDPEPRNGKVPHSVLRHPLDWAAEYTGVDRGAIEAIGVTADGQSICFSFPDGTRKCRTAGTKDWTWEPDNAPRPPIWPLLDEYPDTIVLTEGETDTIVLRACGVDAFAITKGANGSLTPSEIDALRDRGVGRIVVAFDMDKAGREASQELSASIVAAGVAVATLRPPANALLGQTDWRDWYRAGGREVPDPDAADSFTTYADLATSDMRHVRWVREGLFAREAITLVAGPPKVGKTTWVFDALAAFERGDEFMGTVSKRARALVMTEEFDSSLWQKVEGRFRDLAFLKRADAAHEGWTFPQALSLSIARCHTEKRSILVVDTLSAWAAIEDENDAAQVTAAIDLIRNAIAGSRLCVVLVHHTRKAGGEHSEGVRGSSAFAASVEIIATFTWGGTPDTRKVEVLSRFAGDNVDLVIARQDGAPVLLGTTEQVRDAQHEERIRALPTEAPGIPRVEIEALWRLGEHATQKHLTTYMRWQRVEKVVDRSGKGARTTYWAPSMPSLKEDA